MDANKPGEIYAPYTINDPEVLKLMIKARKTNKGRDEIDHKSGFASPDISPLYHIRTAMSAIGSGVSGMVRGAKSKGDLDCIAEGLAMLEELELLLRKLFPQE